MSSHPNSLANLPPGQFQKGESGNPGGRPKIAAVREALRAVHDRINPETGKSGAEELAEAIHKQAVAGNIWAARLAVEIVEGLPKSKTTTMVSLAENTSQTTGAAKRLYQRLVTIQQRHEQLVTSTETSPEPVGSASARLRERLEHKGG